MANTQRYRPVLPWMPAERITGNTGAVAEVAYADLKERHSGRVYEDGGRRVTFIVGEGEIKPRAKSFYGESAWSESRNYAEHELNKLWQAHLDRR